MLNQPTSLGTRRALFWLASFGVATIFALAIFIPSSLASPSAAPTLTDNGPAANDPAVSVSADITATFSADLEATSVTSTTFAVHSPFYGLVTGTLGVNTSQITLSPATPFKVGDQIQVIATTGISNTDGPLTSAEQWGFTTGRVADRCFDTFEDSGETLTSVASGGGRWIDIDGDSDLDVIVTGQTNSGLQTEILINNGVGGFTGSGANTLIAVRDGSLAIGDYNNDGHPDVLMTGLSNGFSPTIQLSRNNANAGGNLFVDSNPDDAALPTFYESAAAWGDYDNDGDIDLLLSGLTGSGAVTKIYRNDAGTLTDSGTDDDALPLVKNSAAAWGDYDGDGDLDLIVTGDSTGGLVAQLFRNDAGVLVDSGAADAALVGMKQGSVAWADIDADGDLDLAMSGLGTDEPVTKIYRNDAGTFVDTSAPLTGVTQSDMAFGDYDNDGDLDLVVVGRALAGPSAAIYENDGGTFSLHVRASANLPGVSNGTVAFGDADDDGDVDLLITGESNLGPVSKIFTNENCGVVINAPVSSLEGDVGNTPFTFTISRTGDKAVTVTYTVSSSGGGNAADASDLTGGFTTGTVTVLAGSPSQNLTINVLGDSVLEQDEIFNVTISDSTAEADLDTALAVGTILNDDSEVHISALSADKLEGDAGNTAFTFTISRTGYLNKAITIPYTIAGDTNGTDFSGATSGNHILPSSSASNVLTINVQGDTDVELDETFTVTLGPPPNGTTISTATANGIIQNDDGDLDIFALDAAKDEGDVGNTTFTFEAVRSGIVTASATVEYAVTGSSGLNPADTADFGGLFASDTITFGVGITTQIISIDASGDTVFESDETFKVTLSNATGGAVIGIATATGTIQNDDTGLTLTAANGSDAEGNDLTFTVTRSGNVSGLTDVNYAVAGIGTYPVDATDFGGSLPSGTVSFGATETSKTITLTTSADITVEADETFTVTLSGPSNDANILTGSATGTIENDDGTVSISPDGLSQVEGDSGTITYTYSVQLSAAAVTTVTVNYAASGTGANPANSTDMGGSFPSGTLTFGIGEDTKQIEVVVSGDTTVETDETFITTLSDMTGGYTIATATVTGTIGNDDRSISIAVDSAVKDEGDSGNTAFTFLISRAGLSTGAITAEYAVVLNSATADDFSGGIVPSGTVSLADGQITTTLTVNISGDTTVEPNETFDVKLTNPTGALLQTGQAAGVIQNDDSGYSISAVTASQPEGNSGSTQFTFKIKRHGTSATASSISWTVSGTGANPADEADFGGFFEASISPFQSGQTDQEIEISVSVSGDTDVEADEAFMVTLSNPTNGEIIATATAVATIENDDDGIQISALPGEQSQAEGNGGTTSFDFTIDLIGTYVQTVTVDYAVTGSGANSADAVDFAGGTLPSGTISFPVGVNSQSLSIPVQGDTISEADEGFTITLSNPTGGAALGLTTITGTIENDDSSLTTSSVFLPLIASPPALTPDLVVDSVTIVGGIPTVVIRNIGGAAVTEDFWVDLYVNPVTVPTMANDTIETLQSDGMVWGLTGGDLPLAAGQTLTLTPSSSSLTVETTLTSIPAGAAVYVQVDSANLNTTYGAILEGHEIDNGPYNNISSLITTR